MLQLPRPLQLMKILSPEMVKVFLEQLKILKKTSEKWHDSNVVRADTADIFIHDLLETLQPLNRQYVAWRIDHRRSSSGCIPTGIRREHNLPDHSPTRRSTWRASP